MERQQYDGLKNKLSERGSEKEICVSTANPNAIAWLNQAGIAVSEEQPNFTTHYIDGDGDGDVDEVVRAHKPPIESLDPFSTFLPYGQISHRNHKFKQLLGLLNDCEVQADKVTMSMQE